MRKRFPSLPVLGLAIVLGACGKSADKPAEPVAAQSLLADFLKRSGQDFEKCFAGVPAMRGPGAGQTVADGPARPVVVNRLVIAIDASGSMAGKVGGETKMAAAKRAATAFLSGVPKGTQVGLVAFGHRGTNQPAGKAASCAAVETVYPLGAADAAQVDGAMRRFEATGWTPLAAAITAAGASFTPSDTPGAQVVYVVSDGLETCGGDPVAAARALNAGPVKAIVNIIGFELTAADRAQLQAVAAAGGGQLVEASSGSDLSRQLDALRHSAAVVSAVTTARFDGGARTTDNNFAVGRFTTDMNFCLYHRTSDESAALRRQFEADPPTPEVREALLEALRRRHAAYVDRATKLSAELLARGNSANASIDARTARTERELEAR